MNANRAHHPGLWWALKGGGNNFGIVTQMTVKAFPQGKLWAGSRYFPTQPYNRSLITAYVNLVNKMSEDPYGHLIMAFSESAQVGQIAAIDFDYGLPIKNPPIFKEFNALTPIFDTMTIRTLSNVTIEFNQSNPGGYRWAKPFLTV